MDNVLVFFMRSAYVLFFVLALSTAQIILSDVKACTDCLERVMEQDDVLHYRMKSTEDF